MSDNQDKSDKTANKFHGRSFGKYRLINDDELPRLTTEPSSAGDVSAGADRGGNGEPRPDSRTRAGRADRLDRTDRADGQRRDDPADRGARGMAIRTGRGVRADRTLRADLADRGMRADRAMRAALADRGVRTDLEDRRAQADRDDGGAGAHRPDRAMRGERAMRVNPADRGLPSDSEGGGRPRTDRPERGVRAERAGRPDPLERTGPAAQAGAPDAEPARSDEGAQGRAGSRKGSCPSWLKSRVYKGKRPNGSDKNLLELQELIIRHSPVGTAVLDDRGRVRVRNGAFMEVIGLEADSHVEDIEEVADMIDGVDLWEMFWGAVETCTSVECEEEVRVADGDEALIHVLFVPVTLPSEASWCVCYIERAYERVVERVVENRAPTNQIYEYQNYIARLATSSADAIVGLDAKGIVKYWNQGAEALFGFTEDEIVGRNALVLVPEDLRREAQLVLKVVLEKGVYRNFDTHRLNKSGERVPVTMTISAVRDEDGNFAGTAATCRDLRDAKDLHEKALEAEKLNAVLQVAVSVYHQINDPLCVIGANAQLLLSQSGGEDEERTKRLKSIADSAKKITRVLDSLSELTGVEPEIATSEDEDAAA